MKLNVVAERVRAGETVTFIAHGNSMTPRLRSGDTVTVSPLAGHEPTKGDIVLAKVHGRYYLHKVTAYRAGKYQISNNHGHVNGWASEVLGILVT